jgi:P27 family predicted phage terminase small subunit
LPWRPTVKSGKEDYIMPPRKLRPFTAAGAREISGVPLVDVPAPPEWMDEVGRRKFEEVGAYLVALGAITAGEVPLLEMFATTYARWIAAEKILAAGDPGWRTVIGRTGTEGTAVPTAAMLQARTSIDQLRRLGAALGLAPVERAKLPAVRQGREEDEVERMFQTACCG